jgi:hypothetical protein
VDIVACVAGAAVSGGAVRAVVGAAVARVLCGTLVGTVTTGAAVVATATVVEVVGIEVVDVVELVVFAEPQPAAPSATTAIMILARAVARKEAGIAFPLRRQQLRGQYTSYSGWRSAFLPFPDNPFHV